MTSKSVCRLLFLAAGLGVFGAQLAHSDSDPNDSKDAPNGYWWVCKIDLVAGSPPVVVKESKAHGTGDTLGWAKRDGLAECNRDESTSSLSCQISECKLERAPYMPHRTPSQPDSSSGTGSQGSGPSCALDCTTSWTDLLGKSDNSNYFDFTDNCVSFLHGYVADMDTVGQHLCLKNNQNKAVVTGYGSDFIKAREDARARCDAKKPSHAYAADSHYGYYDCNP
jgi:hypothetical protein